jgi:hypothetical protein
MTRINYLLSWLRVGSGTSLELASQVWTSPKLFLVTGLAPVPPLFPAAPKLCCSGARALPPPPTHCLQSWQNVHRKHVS